MSSMPNFYVPQKVFRPDDPVKLRGKDTPCWKCDKTRREVKGARFAVCSGCRIALYCSKKCQSADWPAHKQGQAEWLSTRPEAVEALRAGMPDDIHLRAMLRDFIETHRPAYSGILQAKLVLFRGADKFLASEPQVCLVPLRHRAPPSAAADVASCNPALTFLPCPRASRSSRSRAPEHAAAIAHALEAYGAQRDSLRAAHRDDPDFVDTILVKSTPDVGPAQVAGFPRRARALAKAEAQVDLEGYRTFIDIGIVLREREEGSSEGPVPGYLRLDGRKWAWTPLVDDCRTDKERAQRLSSNARVKLIERRLRAVQPHPN
ncbi:hypothetical protein ACG7TL_002405 [Trametes sanguinea]